MPFPWFSVTPRTKPVSCLPLCHSLIIHLATLAFLFLRHIPMFLSTSLRPCFPVAWCAIPLWPLIFLSFTCHLREVFLESPQPNYCSVSCRVWQLDHPVRFQSAQVYLKSLFVRLLTYPPSPTLKESCSHGSSNFVLSTFVSPEPSSAPDTCTQDIRVGCMNEHSSMLCLSPESGCPHFVMVTPCNGNCSKPFYFGAFISFLGYILRYKEGWEVASLIAWGDPEVCRKRLMDLEIVIQWEFAKKYCS